MRAGNPIFSYGQGTISPLVRLILIFLSLSAYANNEKQRPNEFQSFSPTETPACAVPMRLLANYANTADLFPIAFEQDIQRVYHEQANRILADEHSLQVYLKFRMAKLPPELAEEAKDILANHTVVETLGPTFKQPLKTVVAFNRKKYRDSVPPVAIAIALPPRYAETALCNAVKVHELEELLVKEAWLDIEPTTWSQALDQAGLRYFTEKRAMTSEWHYLHALPVYRREEIIEILNGDSETSPAMKQEFLRQFKNASLDLKTYLKLERESGRYSISYIFRESLKSVSRSGDVLSRAENWLAQNSLLDEQEKIAVREFIKSTRR